MSILRWCVLLIVAVSLASCSPRNAAELPTGRVRSKGLGDDKTPRIGLQSAVFIEGSAIPDKYGCRGANVSPPLSWDKPPPATKSLAIICDDPDAQRGTWTHWLVYGVPPSTRELKEAIAPEATLADGARQGTNDYKKSGYGGPCPPGGTHRYHFRIYAVDVPVDLGPGASREELTGALTGHVIAMGELTGTYSK